MYYVYIESNVDVMYFEMQSVMLQNILLWAWPSALLQAVYKMSYIRPRPSITNSKSFQIPSASSTENAAVPGAGLQYTLNHSRVSPLETVQPATVHVRDSSSVLLTGEESILKKQQREIELLIVELRDRDRSVRPPPYSLNIFTFVF